jgi:hypothetical protein
VIRQFNKYHNPPPKYSYDVSKTVAFTDYRGFDICLKCADEEYGTQNFGIGVDRGLLRPLIKGDDVKPCMNCGK